MAATRTTTASRPLLENQTKISHSELAARLDQTRARIEAQESERGTFTGQQPAALLVGSGRPRRSAGLRALPTTRSIVGVRSLARFWHYLGPHLFPSRSSQAVMSGLSFSDAYKERGAAICRYSFDRRTARERAYAYFLSLSTEPWKPSGTPFPATPAARFCIPS